jgi:hypothetical protein
LAIIVLRCSYACLFAVTGGLLTWFTPNEERQNMPLRIDSPMAAYGVFQIAFANLDTQVSRCLVDLCRCQKAKLAFSAFRRKPISERLRLLQRAVSHLRDEPSFNQEVGDLKEACELAESLSKWRNQRIHAEVRFIENQPVLLDESGKLLDIDLEACVEKTREAVRAKVGMQAAIPSFVAYEKDLEELMEE